MNTVFSAFLEISPLFVAELVLLGIIGGFLAGLLGIGGGMFLVPALTFVYTQQGFDPATLVKMAIATSLSTIMLTSISSVRAHHGRGAVRWPLLKSFAPGIVAGSLVGAQVAGLLPAAVLALVFAVFVTYSGAQMFLDRKPAPSRTLPGAVGMAGAGSGIGFLSAIVGTGGGFASVPFMVWCNVPIHTAIGTSAALGFPIAAAGTVGYVVAGWNLPTAQAGAFGYLHLPSFVMISLASVVCAPLGAKVAHSMNVRQLKKAFSLLLFVLAAYMAFKGLA